MNKAPRIEAEILAQTHARGSDKSVCPSEVARALSEGQPTEGQPPQDWRQHMHAVRQEAIRLAKAGRIEILRKGKPVEPGEVRGVIRLRSRGAA